MPVEDPFEAYKRRKNEQADPPKRRRPLVKPPARKSRSDVPIVRPKTGQAPKPAPAGASGDPPRPRLVAHKFDEADIRKMPNEGIADEDFDPPKPRGLQKHAFHTDDVGKMPSDADLDGDVDVAEGKKARGLVRHKFAKVDLMQMGDDRDFEAAAPAGLQTGAFHEDDHAALEAAGAAGGAVEVKRPAGFSSDRYDSGIGQPISPEETREEAIARRRRQKGRGLYSSGHTRRLKKVEDSEPRPEPRVPGDDGT